MFHLLRTLSRKITITTYRYPTRAGQIIAKAIQLTTANSNEGSNNDPNSDSSFATPSESSSSSSSSSSEDTNTMATFSLSPASIDNTVLDYIDKADIKKFEKAIAKLNNEFNGKSEQMTVFKGDLHLHSTNNGWNNGLENSDIISITTLADVDVSHNLIKENSQLTTADITSWAMVNVVTQTTRKAQNNANMYQCLYNSLSTNMVNMMLLVEKEKHHIQNVPITTLFYKVIMGHSNVDMLATIPLTRHLLTTLDSKMIDLDSIIREFNVHVQEL